VNSKRDLGGIHLLIFEVPEYLFKIVFRPTHMPEAERQACLGVTGELVDKYEALERLLEDGAGSFEAAKAWVEVPLGKQWMQTLFDGKQAGVLMPGSARTRLVIAARAIPIVGGELAQWAMTTAARGHRLSMFKLAEEWARLAISDDTPDNLRKRLSDIADDEKHRASRLTPQQIDERLRAATDPTPEEIEALRTNVRLNIEVNRTVVKEVRSNLIRASKYRGTREM
jgi:hypothetical protein